MEWGLLHIITRGIAELMYEPSITKIHYQKKEMQLSNFLKRWIFIILYVLKLPSVSSEPEIFLERGILHIVTKSIGKLNSYDCLCIASSGI